MQGYGAMPFGMGFAGEEKKRRRPPSLLLDESPLKVPLRINSVKCVDPSKDDEGDAFAAMQAVVDEANKEDEESSDGDLLFEDADDDGISALAEKLLGTSDDDPNDKPTEAEAKAAEEEWEAENAEE